MEDLNMGWSPFAWNRNRSELTQVCEQDIDAVACSATRLAVADIDRSSSCVQLLQTPGLSSATPSICTDFMGQSRTHSLSSSYAAVSQPSSCSTSPKIPPVHSFSQQFEDGSDEVCEVDCTLSLGTAATRKRPRTHIPTQMSRSGSPARGAENGSSRFMLLWPPASSGSKLIGSRLPIAFQDWEQFTEHRSHEDQVGRNLGLNVVSKTRDLMESNCRNPYPQCKGTSSSRRPWSPVSNSQVLNDAILKLLPSNRGSEFLSLSSWNPTYRNTNEVSADPGSILQFAPGKTFIDQWNVPRSCAHCGTSKTPLWRNGPLGPKSLCNACGIRYKKVGRRICGRS
ncbi:hypothetical protein O6H91_03G044800 [Diphasiastrum complanatum]|uniref:Uncharacterized protein n=1 Tax=Diphasiastrum complanatum TaxID=34168 RepID=A0ACC2E5P8_DIPCM|nr:hypothetical protein O6H91_03G044800 [Diphasiastrum complanatum]